ncbi:hypothetical protein [Kribbella monticola]|uniref:hypothetical protein n=1 Tax=Kribbella monticola TaxID=2185285 RepID=UPI0013005006|nr:hypothetical protein [Kribbella monticola]
MESTTRTARALAVSLVLGAILMAWVASGIGVTSPFEADDPGELSATYAVLGAWLVAYLLVAALAAIDAGRLARSGELDALQQSANLVKLVAIAFFALNFVVLAEAVAVTGSNDRDRFGLDGFAAALLFMVLTYVVLLPTSAYGVACLTQLRKFGQIGRTFFAINLVLHFLFVLDVLSGIVVVEVARDRLGTARRPSAVLRNLLAIVLAPGSAVAIVWLACVVIYYWFDPPASAFFWDGMQQLTISTPAEFFLLVLVPVVPLITFRAAVQLFLSDDVDALSRSARTVKLTMIPLFVQNFVLCVFVVAVVAFFPVIITRGALLEGGPLVLTVLGTIAAAGFVPALIGTYLMMLPTSIYSITCLILLARHRAISPRFFAIHLILQLVFVTDIISTLVIAHRVHQLQSTASRRTEPTAVLS